MTASPHTPSNYITLSRIVMVPLIMYMLTFDDKTSSLVAAAVFIVAAATDWLDGYLARRYDNITALGKFLDPLADKLMVSATMIMLIPLGRIEAWIVVIILGREMAITGLRGMASNEGHVIAASSLGKYKTTFQMIALSLLLIHFEYFGIDFHIAGTYVLWVALFFTIWSGMDYLIKFKDIFTRKVE